MHLARINLQHIDFSDDTYTLTPACCSQGVAPALLDSIKRCGILHPPMVKEKSAVSFAVVSGRKRLLAARQVLATVSCDCHKLTEQTPEIDILALALEDALLSGPLTPVQLAVFFNKALQFIDEQELAGRFLPLLGLTASTFHIHRALKLLTLEDPLIIAVHEGIVDDKVAFELTRFPFSDRVALFEVISALRLSVGNQQKLLISCRELAARHDTTVAELLRAPAVDAILNHSEANLPQKTAKLMKWLNCERFPRLSRAEQEFQHFVAGLGLPATARLEHSPAFEKDELLFTLACADQSEFLRIWANIRGLMPPQKQGRPIHEHQEKKE